MIRYSLSCSQGHSFESWFQSAAAFDDLSGRGLLECAVCGGSEVSKAIMAPQVTTAEREGRTARTPAQSPPSDRPLSTPASPAEQALAAFRKQLEKNSQYVGGRFAEEARKIHLGDAPERLIHGEAGPEEARALIEDGVPILPLPVSPKSRSN